LTAAALLAVKLGAFDIGTNTVLMLAVEIGVDRK